MPPVVGGLTLKMTDPPPADIAAQGGDGSDRPKLKRRMSDGPQQPSLKDFFFGDLNELMA